MNNLPLPPLPQNQPPPLLISMQPPQTKQTTEPNLQTGELKSPGVGDTHTFQYGDKNDDPKKEQIVNISQAPLKHYEQIKDSVDLNAPEHKKIDPESISYHGENHVGTQTTNETKDIFLKTLPLPPKSDINQLPSHSKLDPSIKSEKINVKEPPKNVLKTEKEYMYAKELILLSSKDNKLVFKIPVDDSGKPIGEQKQLSSVPREKDRLGVLDKSIGNAIESRKAVDELLIRISKFVKEIKTQPLNNLKAVKNAYEKIEGVVEDLKKLDQKELDQKDKHWIGQVISNQKNLRKPFDKFKSKTNEYLKELSSKKETLELEQKKPSTETMPSEKEHVSSEDIKLFAGHELKEAENEFDKLPPKNQQNIHQTINTVGTFADKVFDAKEEGQLTPKEALEKLLQAQDKLSKLPKDEKNLNLKNTGFKLKTWISELKDEISQDKDSILTDSRKITPIIPKLNLEKPSPKSEDLKSTLTEVIQPNEIQEINILQNQSQKIEEIVNKIKPEPKPENVNIKTNEITSTESTQKIENVIQPIIEKIKPPPQPSSPLKTPTIMFTSKAILEDKIDVDITTDKEGKEIKTPTFSSEAAMIGFLLRGEDESLKGVDIPLTRSMILSEFRNYFSPQQLIMGFVSASFEKGVPIDKILENTVALAKDAGITIKKLEKAFYQSGSDDPIIKGRFENPESAQLWVKELVKKFAERPILETPKIPENPSPQKIVTEGNLLSGNVESIAHDIFTINASYMLEIKETKNISIPEAKTNDLDNPKAKEWTEAFNSMSNVLQENILKQTTLKERVQAITDTISLGIKLLEMGDLSGAMMVSLTLGTVPVERLIHTWPLVDKKSLDDLAKLSDICSIQKNYPKLREKHTDSTSFIPYFGIFGKDHVISGEVPNKHITSVEVPNKHIDNSINYSKIELTYKSRTTFTGLKDRLKEKISKDPLSFSKKTNFEDLLKNDITEKQLDNLSQTAEPRSLKEKINEIKEMEKSLANAPGEFKSIEEEIVPHENSLQKREGFIDEKRFITDLKEIFTFVDGVKLAYKGKEEEMNVSLKMLAYSLSENNPKVRQLLHNTLPWQELKNRTPIQQLDLMSLHLSVRFNDLKRPLKISAGESGLRTLASALKENKGELKVSKKNGSLKTPLLTKLEKGKKFINEDEFIKSLNDVFEVVDDTLKLHQGKEESIYTSLFSIANSLSENTEIDKLTKENSRNGIKQKLKDLNTLVSKLKKLQTPPTIKKTGFRPLRIPGSSPTKKSILPNFSNLSNLSDVEFSKTSDVVKKEPTEQKLTQKEIKENLEKMQQFRGEISLIENKISGYIYENNDLRKQKQTNEVKNTILLNELKIGFLQEDLKLTPGQKLAEELRKAKFSSIKSNPSYVKSNINTSELTYARLNVETNVTAPSQEIVAVVKEMKTVEIQFLEKMSFLRLAVMEAGPTDEQLKAKILLNIDKVIESSKKFLIRIGDGTNLQQVLNAHDPEYFLEIINNLADFSRNLPAIDSDKYLDKQKLEKFIEENLSIIPKGTILDGQSLFAAPFQKGARYIMTFEVLHKHIDTFNEKTNTSPIELSAIVEIENSLKLMTDVFNRFCA